MTLFKNERDIATEHVKPASEVDVRVERECNQPIDKMKTFAELKNDMESLRALEEGKENLEIIKAVATALPEHSMQTFEAEKQKLEAKNEQKVVSEQGSYKQSVQDVRQGQGGDIELDASESNSFEI
ncbi:TPA: hypothetical protein ACPSKT_000591 [Legionella anisa]